MITSDSTRKSEDIDAYVVSYNPEESVSGVDSVSEGGDENQCPNIVSNSTKLPASPNRGKSTVKRASSKSASLPKALKAPRTSRTRKTSPGEAGKASDKSFWSDEEIRDFLLAYDEMKVNNFSDHTGYSTNFIYVRLADKLPQYNRTANQISSSIRTQYNGVKKCLSNSGKGTAEKDAFPHWDLMDNIMQDRGQVR